MEIAKRERERFSFMTCLATPKNAINKKRREIPSAVANDVAFITEKGNINNKATLDRPLRRHS